MLKELEKHLTCEYMFPSPNGGPISPDSVRHMLHRVLKRTGLPAVRFHDLCHTFATLAFQNGVDIKTVSGMRSATSPLASPWTPTPTSLQPRRRKQQTSWAAC